MDDEIKVTARIGRGGKIHRARAIREESAPGKPWSRVSYRRLAFCCSCPNTKNGHATHRASIVAEGWAMANCEN